MQRFEIAVIGAGIAGASVAARLAQAGKRVALLDMESQAGYHTTARSAAVFAPSYGPPVIRALARASKAFFTEPPEGFCTAPLLSPRLIMMLARADQLGSLEKLKDQVGDDPEVSIIDETKLRGFNPLVREGYAHSALVDAAGRDIDVGALHQGFLKQFKAAGGVVLLKAHATSLARSGTGWQIDTPVGPIETETLVNASGAWADVVGQMAGAEKVDLTPKRRTVAIIGAPEGAEIADYPITIDIDEQFYLKPDAGRLLISPADETASAPCDAQPEEMDIAICVDRIETAFDLSVRRIENKWAGLRSFVPDGAPVADYSQQVENFFWLVGQGGYGIQTAPALSEYASAKILRRDISEEILEAGVIESDLSIARLG